MEKTTAELASELSHAKDFERFKQNNAGEFKTPTPMDYLLELLNAKNIKHTDATEKLTSLIPTDAGCLTAHLLPVAIICCAMLWPVILHSMKRKLF